MFFDTNSLQGYTPAEACALLADETTENNKYTLAVVADSATSSKAVFGDNGTSASLVAPTTTTGYTSQNLTLTTGEIAPTENGEDYYFGMYVEGDRASTDTNAPDGSFTVTATATK